MKSRRRRLAKARRRYNAQFARAVRERWPIEVRYTSYVTDVADLMDRTDRQIAQATCGLTFASTPTGRNVFHELLMKAKAER